MKLLSLVIWFPILGGVLVLASGGERNASIARKLALGFAIATFLLSLPLYTRFDKSSVAMQFVERAPWIGTLNIEYYLGIDGISMPLILLTTFLKYLFSLHLTFINIFLQIKLRNLFC